MAEALLLPLPRRFVASTVGSSSSSSSPRPQWVLSPAGSRAEPRPARLAAASAPRHRRLKVHAAVSNSSEQPKWWEKNAGPNMIDIHSTQEFLDALRDANERLVVVEFYGTWCGSCRALFPRLCKTALENPDVLFLKAFSCSLAKFQKLKDAVAVHNTARMGPLIPLIELDHDSALAELVSGWDFSPDGFPADEDELPPNGGNPHPFNGEVFPGDPNWVQQWVDDQLPHAGFPKNNIVEQVFPEQQGNINQMEDPPQWEQWPNHNNNAPQMPQQQEELSVEVSGLSVGLNSGSTAASGSNSSGPSAPQHNSMPVIPRALSPPLIPRAPIRLVYSRRQRNLNNDNVTSNMASSAISSGSQNKGDKGKGIMLPGLPSIQDFVCATTDDQVGRDRLMAEAGTSTQLVQAHTNAQLDDDNEG
ncbi:hypothetical protein GUJ93_ZPchr0010g7887 [Zizania palustris]|uniref:Thioredoxin domain-containing protein n=1 Tax=Zizania palustris TaxID=103762 RepID=A0A8J6BB71_ZIZPA|nr:hypothetical protein GUJ93_ZPchr0010g7887 [Zizania palustris]